MTEAIAWDLYRTFLAVLTEGSLSGAARQLGITQPTAGRHIETLEAALRQRLFVRTQAGLVPTPLAQALRSYAETMRSTAAALERAAVSPGEVVSGTVRISASEVIGVEVLPAALAALRRAHPQLVIELVPTDQVQDLLRSEADIAVRMTPPQQEQLIARYVGEVTLGLFAREDYLREQGIPQTPADLAAHALIGPDGMTPFLRRATQTFPGWSRARLAWRSDSTLAQLALIRAGCGIGACQCALAARDARLVRVLADDWTMQLPTWVTLHADLRNSPRCRVTFDALVACLTQHVAAGALPAASPSSSGVPP